ncbi:flagellar basal body-associated protein FliL [Thalassococcus sp. S3]|uniref:flagellar basal body-associated FliL family protein n=1 Tax=Thalassococcus sp. S3 TaxID=2017482 RepID=UPI00102426B0|nr:flagellar basal body-associated FliL family protein [Thalassococcus sp. S3]QBF29690.1 flagellar basal body protein FliL [Thalassococcus sp. S3]
MTDATAEDAEEPVKKSKLPLILGVALAIAGGGGGYFAVSSGLILKGESQKGTANEATVDPLPEIAYVPVDPLIISLTERGQMQHLRFRAQLEVVAKYAADVETVLPRVTDVLNSYLRAVRIEDLQDPLALTRLRAQMLRRIQIVTGEGRVRDLLVMEFVLS